MDISNNSEDVTIENSDNGIDVLINQQNIIISNNSIKTDISVQEEAVTISNNSLQNFISNNTNKVNILVGIQGPSGPSGRWLYKNQITDLVLTNANSYTIFENSGASEQINITIDAAAVTPGNPWSFRVLNTNGINIQSINGTFIYVGTDEVSEISSNQLISTLTIEAQTDNIITITSLTGNWNYAIS